MSDNETLTNELTRLLNLHSQENNSGTPDFILATYMIGALKLFEATTVQRDTWWSFEPMIGGVIPAVDGRAT